MKKPITITLWTACIPAAILFAAAGKQTESQPTSGPTAPAAACFPRIAMMWTPADLRRDKDKWANIARHDVIVAGIDTLGLHFKPHRWHAAAETINPKTAARARANLARIHKLNPTAVVLCEVFFFEEQQDGYPPDHPWWLRNNKGQRVQFWAGAYRMNLSRTDYIVHVARRIQAVYKATGGKAGIFLDNLRTDAASRSAWTSLLKLVRELCGQDMPIQVNAGWQSRDLEWIAPLVNGIAYEDAVNHDKNKDTEAFYLRAHELDRLCRSPQIGVNEVYGDRKDLPRMRRELIRTLVYTNLAYLYADSTYKHRHGWYADWDVPLGAPKAGPAKPAAGKLARRDFHTGTVLWLPASAKKPFTVNLKDTMRNVFDGRDARKVTLKPGTGAILAKPPAKAPASNPTTTSAPARPYFD